MQRLSSHQADVAWRDINLIDPIRKAGLQAFCPRREIYLSRASARTIDNSICVEGNLNNSSEPSILLNYFSLLRYLRASLFA